jgi:hypothetical protein
MGFLKYVVHGVGWEVGRELAQGVKEEVSQTSEKSEHVPTAAEVAEQRAKLRRMEALRAKMEATKAKIRKAEQRAAAENDLAALKRKMDQT